MHADHAGAVIEFPRAAPFASASAAPAARVGAGWPPQLLDELDYGVILLRADGSVAHANQAARDELRRGERLRASEGAICAGPALSPRAFAEALSAARRGLRRLLTFDATQGAGAVAVVPMPSEPPAAPLIALMFGRRRLCEPLSVELFAAARGLTPAEASVLQLLCDGLEPNDIARMKEVRMCTVRTQVYSIQIKTGTHSIRELLHRVAMLPPMTCRLRA